MKKILTALSALLCLGPIAEAQNYQALHGTPYSGSLSNDFNPAAILNSPYTWDVTVLGMQGKFITNSFNVTNASLLKEADTLLIRTHSGTFERNLLASVDIHLLNARISLSRRTAVAFGLNMRNYLRAVSSAYNYNDTIVTPRDFMAANIGNTPLSVNMVQSSWLEAYATYSHVLFEDDGSRLQAGGTLSVLRSLSGAYAYAADAQYIPDGNGFQMTNAEAQYGYSEFWDGNSKASAIDKLKDAVKKGQLGASISIGAEYVQKSGDDWGRQEKSGTDEYDWKLGAALLDLGTNSFIYGSASGVFSGVKGVVTDSTLNTSFHNLSGLGQFDDTVQQKADHFSFVSGRFNVSTPARILLNFDKRLEGYWAVNGELSINLTGIHSNLASVQELNLLTITPRWEKSAIGAYLPLEITNQGHFWVGGAIKAGPLVLGLHNLGWLVSKKSLPNGGGYLAIIIHPGVREKEGVPCPKF
jgi:hypothetical protein